jgi:hypothetical protein
MVATTLNGSGLFQYEQRLGDPDPFSNFLGIPLWPVGSEEALTRWPPSAAQTARADFPHAAFTKT